MRGVFYCFFKHVLLCMLLLNCFLSYAAKEDSTEKELLTAVQKLSSNNDKESAEGLRLLNKLSSDRNQFVKYSAKHAMAAYYLDTDKPVMAWPLVKDCADSELLLNISNQDYGTAYLKCYLEAARCKLVQHDPQEALRMLSYAESSMTGIDQILARLKYATAMMSKEVNLPDKAVEYLKSGLAECDKQIGALSNKKLVAGQASAKDDSLSQWQELRSKIAAAQLELEIKLLEVKYGPDYANYVKMRKLYNRGLSAEAEELCEKIIKENSKSKDKERGNVYTESAKLLAAKCVLKDKKIQPEQRIKKSEDMLQRFVKENPYGLYRGEALMMLGQIELEQNWDQKDSAKYYTQAMEWFRYVRDLRDAVGIYSVPDKVKEVSKPQGKFSYLDEWKRTQYRAENEHEIINHKTAPWYVDEMEKECIFMVGLFLFIDGKYDRTLEYFNQLKSLDSDIAMLESKNIPNVLMRLRAACEQKKMLFTADERKKFKGKNLLKMTYAELDFGTSRFDKAKQQFTQIYKDEKNSDFEKAAALIGIGYCNDLMMLGKDKDRRLKLAKETWEKAYELAKGTSLEQHALWMMANYLSASTETQLEALKYYEEYLKKNPGGPQEDAAKFAMGMCYFQLGDTRKTLKYYQELKAKDPNLPQVKEFERLFKLFKLDPNTGKIADKIPINKFTDRKSVKVN